MALLNSLINNGPSRLLGKLYCADTISVSSTDHSAVSKLAVGGYTNTNYDLSTQNLISNSWLRTVGATGWLSETYGGGWYMKDANYIRNYQKPILLEHPLYMGSSSYYLDTSGNVHAHALVAPVLTTDTGTFNNLYVSGTLEAVHYEIKSIANFGGQLMTCPTLIFDESESVQLVVGTVTSTTVDFTITDSGMFASFVSDSGVDSLAGAKWYQNSRIKFSLYTTTGESLNQADGVVTSMLSSSNRALHIQITTTAEKSAQFVANTTYTHANIENMSVMVYQVPTTNGGNTLYPIGIFIMSYGRNKQSYIDIYGGTTNLPAARLGRVGSLLDDNGDVVTVNGQAMQGWGLYTNNGYFTGTVVSQSGNIGGWQIGDASLSNGTLGSASYLYVGTGNVGTATAIGGSTAISNWRIIAGNKFGVTNAGSVWASDLHATGGNIAGWTINTTQLSYGTLGSANSIHLIPAAGQTASLASRSANDWVVSAGANLGITKTGALYCSDAHVTGEITATSGTIGGCTIVNGVLTVPYAQITGTYGGRNLLRKSGARISTDSYHMRQYYFGADPPKEGETVTIQIKGTLAEGKSSFGIYNSGGSVPVTFLQHSTYDESTGIYTKTFTWAVRTASNKFMSVYQMMSDESGTSEIQWIKLERGTNATDWSLAPEDNQDDVINGTQTAAGAAWTGVANFPVLEDGQEITYWLPYAGASDVTLELTLSDGTTTGAVNCYYGGTTRLGTHYPAGSLIHMIYRRSIPIGASNYTGWWCDANYNADTYNRIRHQNLITAATAITAGRIIVGTKDGYKNIAANVTFDVSYPILYAGSDIAGAASGDNNYLAINGVNVASNKSGWTGTTNSTVYIVGTLSDSTFTVNTTMFTTTVPTAVDNLYYIPIGTMYSTTNCYFYYRPDIYMYYDGAFQTVASSAKKAADNALSWIDSDGAPLYSMINKWTNNAVSDITTINGGWIDTNTITADKIAIGDFRNYVTANEANSKTKITGNNPCDDCSISGGYITKTAATNTYIALTHYTFNSFQDGDEVYYTFTAKGASAVTCRLTVYFYGNDATDGSYTGKVAYPGASAVLSTTEQTFTGSITLTTCSGKSVYAIGIADISDPKAQIYVKNVAVYKRYAGNLIVDGAITTNKLTANAVTTAKLATDAIKSTNYAYSSGNYSTAGSFFDLSNGMIRSKNFYIDASGNAYLKGNIAATAGSIAGWSIASNNIHKTIAAADSPDGKAFMIAMSSNYYDQSNANPYNPIFYVNYDGSYTFYVRSTGAMYCSQADITGKITSTSGKIGGWNIDTHRLYTTTTAGYTLDMRDYDYNNNRIAFQLTDASGNTTTYPFRLYYNGIFESTNARITGQVTATSGSIAGWSIASNNIHKTVAAADSPDGKAFTIAMSSNYYTAANTNPYNPIFYVNYDGNYTFYVRSTGAMYCSSVDVTGKVNATSGSIGGWTIGSTKLEKRFDSGTNSYRAAIQSPDPNSPQVTNYAFFVATSTDTGSTWAYPFAVRYDGKLITSNAQIQGDITASSITALNTYYIHSSSGTKKVALQAPDASFGSSLELGVGFTAVHTSGQLITGGNLQVLEDGTGTIMCGNITSGKNYYLTTGKVTTHNITTPANAYISSEGGYYFHTIADPQANAPIAALTTNSAYTELSVGSDFSQTTLYEGIINTGGANVIYRSSNDNAIYIGDSSYADEIVLNCDVNTTKAFFTSAASVWGYSAIGGGGSFNAVSTSKKEMAFYAENDGRGGRFLVSTAYNLGIYDKTNDQWVIRSDSDTIVHIPHLLYTYPVNNPGVERLAITTGVNGYRIGQLYTNTSGSTKRLGINCEMDGVVGTYGSYYITIPTSDIRLKENIKNTTVKNALDAINKIKLRSFDWKSGGHQEIGFIADELEKIDPQLASGGGYDEDGNIIAKSVDTFYLLGYLTKAVQELSGRIDKLLDDDGR